MLCIDQKNTDSLRELSLRSGSSPHVSPIMKKNTIWGGEVELLAAATAYRVQIQVYDTSVTQQSAQPLMTPYEPTIWRLHKIDQRELHLFKLELSYG